LSTDHYLLNLSMTRLLFSCFSLALLASQPGFADGSGNYQRTCSACHNLGVAGAPRISEPSLWKDRIDKGIDTLVEHAINGFAGNDGVMPPKGGFTQLTDEEVREIVEYMVSKVE